MHFGIFGAGSIGCYVGGMLAASGDRVTFVGRSAMARRLSAGMDLTRYDGFDRELDPQSIDFVTGSTSLADCDVVLVCVKSGDTAEAGRVLKAATGERTVIVSMQNGVSNAATLRDALPGRTVLSSMVPFNVARIGESRFHRGTEGATVIEEGGSAVEIARHLTEAGVPATVTDNIEPVLWGKLVMNLNNAVNLLSGRPLKAQLMDRDYRRVLAASVREALSVLDTAGIEPARIGKVRPSIIPTVLGLPNWLFRLVARGMLKIDDKARSSMAEDMEAGRKPEIDYLNGEIVRLGGKTGTPVPVNVRLVELVEQAFAAGASPALSGRELAGRLGL